MRAALTYASALVVALVLIERCDPTMPGDQQFLLVFAASYLAAGFMDVLIEIKDAVKKRTED